MAEKDGEVIGAALTLPDINQVMAKLNGRLLPFGWLRVPARQAQDRPAAGLRARRQARLPPHRRRRRPLPQAPRDGGPARATIEGGEMGWILETNEPMNRAMEGMGGKVVKRYRVYEQVAVRPSRRTFRGLRNPRRVPTHALARLRRVSEKFDLDGEVLAEEDVGPGAEQPTRVAASPTASSGSPVLRTEVRTAAIAAAGGALAGRRDRRRGPRGQRRRLPQAAPRGGCSRAGRAARQRPRQPLLPCRRPPARPLSAA